MRKLMLLMSIPMGIVLATVPVQAARGDRMISFSAGTAMPRRDLVGRAPAGVIGGVGLNTWPPPTSRSGSKVPSSGLATKPPWPLARP